MITFADGERKGLVRLGTATIPGTNIYLLNKSLKEGIIQLQYSLVKKLVWYSTVIWIQIPQKTDHFN